jgi:excisionase family DNA binding protein
MKQTFSTKEAAKYLGISSNTMRYHIFYAKNIEGQKIGNSLIFTREQLDEFKAVKRSQGRPKGRRKDNYA